MNNNQKEAFDPAQIEVIEFETADVICTSGADETEGDDSIGQYYMPLK